MSLPSHMRAYTIEANRLTLTQLPVPTPAAGEVLIRVSYIGLNRADVMQVAGNYAPPPGASPLPGLEVSGTIAALGGGVTGFSLNQPVCALLPGGGYAEYVVADAALTLPVPAGLDLKEAASLPEAAATSIMALLAEGRLKPGERVLIHGGASGLGILMCQIARSYSAEMFATVGSAEKAQLLQSFGITPLNHRAAPFGEQLMAITNNEGVDLIIDILGAPSLETHLRCLRRGGRMVMLAMLEGSEIPAGVKMTRILMNHLTLSGATLRSRSLAEKTAYMQEVRENLWPKLATGAIKPVLDQVFAFTDAEKAQKRMQERLHMGKILLEVTAK